MAPVRPCYGRAMPGIRTLAVATLAAALTGCSTPAPSPSATASPAPPGLGAGNCTAPGTVTSAIEATTPERYSLGLTGTWEDVSAAHQPRFITWLRRDGSADDALRIADVTTAASGDAVAAAMRARQADLSAGAAVGDVTRCTVAGEAAAFYSADYPDLPPAMLMLLVHRGHTYQVEIDFSTADRPAVIAEAKVMLGTWTWG